MTPYDPLQRVFIPSLEYNPKLANPHPIPQPKQQLTLKATRFFIPKTLGKKTFFF